MKTTVSRRPSFEDACRRYIHRSTMEHVPAWAKEARPDGSFYAPHYRSDREWYDSTRFPGEPEHIMGKQHRGHCDSRGATWPKGKSLKAPFTV